MCGNTPALGDYDAEQAVQLYTTPEDYPVWKTLRPVVVPRGTAIRYKYIIMSGGRPSYWEGIEGERTVVPTSSRMTIEDTFGRHDDGDDDEVEQRAPIHLPSGDQTGPFLARIPSDLSSTGEINFSVLSFNESSKILFIPSLNLLE